jgi:hypothetical protein
LEIEPTIEEMIPQVLFLGFQFFSPQVGVRMSWGFGGSDAYYVALEV